MAKVQIAKNKLDEQRGPYDSRPPHSLDLLPSGFPAVDSVPIRTRRGSVQYEITLALIDNYRYVRAVERRTPTVRDYAVRTYRIRSRKFDRSERVAGSSSEERTRKTALSVGCESGDRSEQLSGSVKTITGLHPVLGLL